MSKPISEMSPEELEHHINGESHSPTVLQSLPTVQQSSVESSNYADGFDIKDPVELLVLINKDIREGRIQLHKWQVQFMLDFAAGDRNKDLPFQAVVRACNGSGKDKYILAPCAVWLGMRYPKVREIVTSSSGDQLDNQTDAYINQLCRDVNNLFGIDVWKINYRYYECLLTGSQMKLYATDEPGKAEGYHPLIDGGKMGIFLSEGKSIPDDIFAAIDRCTGYTHRIDVSTPGLPQGVFFDNCLSSVNRNDVKDIYEVPFDQYVQYHVKAYDCPHISHNEIERMRRKMPTFTFMSAVDAEFTTNNEMVVIPYGMVTSSVRNAESRVGWLKEPFNTGGLDLSAGGDETVLSVRNGNKLLKIIPFQFDNTEDTINHLDELFRDNGLAFSEAIIYADVGGLGEPMLNTLRGKGWKNIRFVDNRNTPYQPRVYANRGAESWWKLRELVESGEIILANDDKTIRQLSTRKYKMNEKNQIQLQSKLKMKAEGRPSPDRADSVVLCFWNYKSKLDSNLQPSKEDRTPFKLPEIPKTSTDFTIKKWANREDDKPTARYQRANPKDADLSYLQSELQRYNQKHKLTTK